MLAAGDIDRDEFDLVGEPLFLQRDTHPGGIGKALEVVDFYSDVSGSIDWGYLSIDR